MEKQRIEFIDLAKGFCIILVVLYHLSEYYQLAMPFGNFFKAFRLPLYFFLSGMFFKEYNGFVDFVKRKTNKLLIPFLFWLLFVSFVVVNILKIFEIEIWHVDDSIGGYFRDVIMNRKLPNAPIWFLLCLFEVNIIFYVCMMLSKRSGKRNVCLILLCAFCGVLGCGMSLLRIKIPAFIDSAFSAVPFFMFGYVITQKTNFLLPQSWDKYIPIIVILLFVVVYIFAPFYSLKYNNMSIYAVITMYPCGLFGTMGVILISKWFKHVPVIVWWGRYSIMILVSHGIIYRILGLIPIFSSTHNDWWTLCLTLVCTLAICSIMIPLYKKWLPHVTAQKDVIPIK